MERCRRNNFCDWLDVKREDLPFTCVYLPNIVEIFDRISSWKPALKLIRTITAAYNFYYNIASVDCMHCLFETGHPGFSELVEYIVGGCNPSDRLLRLGAKEVGIHLALVFFLDTLLTICRFGA